MFHKLCIINLYYAYEIIYLAIPAFFGALFVRQRDANVIGLLL